MSRLYHYPISSSSRFIRLILSEYEFKPDMIEEYPWGKRREFLELNPSGTLPVYVDEHMQALCGFTVISEYLDETYGDVTQRNRLLSTDPLQRAETRRMIEWFMHQMEQDATRPLVHERVYKLHMTTEQGGGSPDSKALRIARNNIREHLKYISWLIKSRSWIAGNHMSYADFAASATISTLDYLGEIDWDNAPIVKEWYQRMKSRPSFRPLLSERIRGLLPSSHYTNLDF
ncbi:glutathione S-transferase family protein [Candidatus Liberibacter africanus]|uniref:Glutathione S-transferase n=1 Tax=Candidatus Liberibacter africanus PTSAPSY TaxID=1277257 RepID=A0A0G3I703_LIBAF|nr:glutathione S-transferase family protein [Candidatus Liberibacter africanus]AKK20313.1 glutathione S-transferase [Candidatus Liberibacter africanus PTSAPSY]QTP64066.1 glutathione S-transferase family protein [Candidatus Liberibacter africanus]